MSTGRIKLSAFIIGLSLITRVGSVSADEQSNVPDILGWPFLRGAQYDGHSSEVGLAESWPPDGPPVLWARELGQGYSGFVAVV